MRTARYTIAIDTPDKRDEEGTRPRFDEPREFYCTSEDDAVEQGAKWVKFLVESGEYEPTSNYVNLKITRHTKTYRIVL
jgi:hypothetical protein